MIVVSMFCKIFTITLDKVQFICYFYCMFSTFRRKEIVFPPEPWVLSDDPKFEYFHLIALESDSKQFWNGPNHRSLQAISVLHSKEWHLYAFFGLSDTTKLRNQMLHKL